MGKRYYGGVITGLGLGFFAGFGLAGDGVIPYNGLTRIVVLVLALGLVVVCGPLLARTEKPKEQTVNSEPSASADGGRDAGS